MNIFTSTFTKLIYSKDYQAEDKKERVQKFRPCNKCGEATKKFHTVNRTLLPICEKCEKE